MWNPKIEFHLAVLIICKNRNVYKYVKIQILKFEIPEDYQRHCWNVGQAHRCMSWTVAFQIVNVIWKGKFPKATIDYWHSESEIVVYYFVNVECTLELTYENLIKQFPCI